MFFFDSICDATFLPCDFIVLPLTGYKPNTVKFLPGFFIVKFYRVGELWPYRMGSEFLVFHKTVSYGPKTKNGFWIHETLPASRMEGRGEGY